MPLVNLPDRLQEDFELLRRLEAQPAFFKQFTKLAHSSVLTFWVVPVLVPIHSNSGLSSAFAMCPPAPTSAPSVPSARGVRSTRPPARP